MPRDKTASHEKILSAARMEFLEYGYINASMRRIAERAGMTAAGLYRHCRDKADLFDLLVSPAAEDMKSWLGAHISRANESVAGNPDALWQNTEINMLRELVYPRMEEYQLLLAKAQGTKYEHYLHDLVEERQHHMIAAFAALKAQGRPVRDIGEHELHLLLSAYTTAMFEPVIHGYSLDEALKSLEIVEAFFMPGWKQIMGFQ